jgi:benzoate transport
MGKESAQYNGSWTWIGVFTVALCFALNMLDGADILVLSFAAPVLIEEWQVSEAAFGIAFSSGLIGMTMGSLFLAPFADRWGRKPLVLISTTLIATGMLLSALVENVTQLAVLRFVTGTGIGGILATIAILASEFAPRKFVAAAVMTVMAGYPAGAMLAGLVANKLLPTFGWQSLFIATGCCSAVLIPIIYFFAPESTGFLLNRQKQGDLERANRVLAAQGLAPLTAYPGKDRRAAKALPFLDLFRRDLRVTTMLCWTSFVGALFVVYFLQSWIPRMATIAGYSLETAITGSAIFNGGAIAGLLLVGWLTARWNLGKVIAILYCSATIIMIVFAQWNSPVIVFYVLLGAMGFFQQTGNGAMYAAVTRVYSTDIKTTALGWAVGVGRAGGVMGPAAGGIALSAGMSISWMFVVFSLPLLVTAACVLAIGLRHFAK